MQTKKDGNDVTITNYRYQYGNHLNSAALELNHKAETISYEEYHPFGTTSYQLHDNQTDVSSKRYRYCGKERDEESGLYYYGARYYAAWLCRFVSVDPLKDKYPYYTTYQYAGNKPITFIDLDGLEEALPPKSKGGGLPFAGLVARQYPKTAGALMGYLNYGMNLFNISQKTFGKQRRTSILVKLYLHQLLTLCFYTPLINY